MNKRYDKNYGKKDEEEDEEPVRLTLRQRIAEHRLRHPHDLISFGEDPIPKPHKPQLSKREKPSGEFLISRYETRLIEGAKEEEDEHSDENEEYQVTWTSESLLECSVSELQTMSSIMFREFMEWGARCKYDEEFDRAYQAVGLTRPSAAYSQYCRALNTTASEGPGYRRAGGRARAVHLFVVFVARLVEGIKRLSLPSPRAPAQAERRPAARAPCTMELRSWVPPAVSVGAP